VLKEVVARADLRAPDPADEKVVMRNITMAPKHGARVVLERPLRGPVLPGDQLAVPLEPSLLAQE
jgi:hypothetical protein